MKPAAVALVVLLSLAGLGAREAPPPEGIPGTAQELQGLLIGHWREKSEKARISDDQTDYYFGQDKCTVHTKGIQGESFSFYDYTLWQAWPLRRTLILALRDDVEAVKWVLEFGVDGKQITYRERNKKTFTKAVTLTRVDEKTEP